MKELIQDPAEKNQTILAVSDKKKEFHSTALLNSNLYWVRLLRIKLPNSIHLPYLMRNKN